MRVVESGGSVQTGLDVLRDSGFSRLRGRKVGLLAHPASVTRDLVHLVDAALEAGLDVRFLLGPEHGLAGTSQDMQTVGNGEVRSGAPRRRIPVISLYGADAASLRPPGDALGEIDVLVADLQDVGSRCYTFAATLRYCLEACAESSVAVVVLDRPNPINGRQVEGPVLRDDHRSFVGAFRVPVRHGLTIGELAVLASSEGLDVDLEVVHVRGWRREQWWDQTGLPWIMPSPNMPTLDTATVYPGSCLVEATNLSEGRGTTRPFELLGAPWLDAASLALELEKLKLPGVHFRATGFRPTFHKHADRICHGVQLHVSDRLRFKPFLTGVAFLQAARRIAGEHFQWREEPYEFVSDRPALDLLTGEPRVREDIERGLHPREMESAWEAETREFRERRRAVLIYPEEPA